MIMIPIYKINMTPKKYVRRVFLPAILISSFLGMALFLILPENLGKFRVVALFIPILGILYPIIYPYIEIDRRKNEIDSRSHFFITAFGVLSVSDVDRKHILKILSEKKELGYLTKEMHKLHVLVERWNQSFAKAARFLAKRTPSKSFADFLDRFAHSQDSGESMERFLFKEQETVMNDYATYYRGALYEIDVFKEIYSAILLSLAFLMAFIIIIPMLVGEDIVRLSLYVTIFFLVIEVGITYFIKSIVPYDPIWHSRDVITRIDRKLLLSFIVSLAGCIAVGTLLLIFRNSGVVSRIPFQFLIAITVTPLLYSGYIARKEENIVKRKDENFPSFLRTLGSSASARGGLILEPLFYLTAHDFGPLTEDIKKLYKRMALRIDAMKSWKFFSAETGSHLIDVFSKLFVESITLGAEPGKVADIIASNFSRILTLRKRKFQVNSSFIGIVYGITAGIAFSIAISFTIAEVTNKLYSGLDVDLSTISGLLYVTPAENLKLVSYIIFAILLIHSFVSAVLIRIIDGGHYLNSLIHFVLLVWTSATVVFVSDKVVSTLISTQI